ncbi:MAG: SPOR domain-containing protein [Hyphomonadaceae bacterium]
MSTRYDPRMRIHDDQTRHAGVLYVLMAVIAIAFGGFVWQLYSAPETPHISAEPGPYKVEPPQGTESIDARPVAPETPAAEPTTGNVLAAPLLPQFVASGPYVAQLAALQSEAGVETAWRRFASRAPQLFAQAQLDVERADLGPRGIYYRVRAGYFANREEAGRFCERIRQMGQDCIAAAR